MRTYPYHLTTDLPELPVPTLQESMERFRTASAAFYDAGAEAEVNQAIADFVIGPAPVLQHTLEDYAAATAESGSSWLAEQTLEHFLGNRAPLPLTDNVTYQLQLSTAATGAERVVELLQRLGSLHILQAKRQAPEEVNAAGQRLSMDGWAVFNGGIRTPAIDHDIWMRAGTGATYRTVGLLYLGRMWEVPLTGSEGKLLNPDQLRASVDFVLAQEQPAEHNFVEFSALGSANLALAAPWQTEPNRSMYSHLANMLFTLTLDPDATDEHDTLHRWATQAGWSWAYKPVSYVAALDSQLLAASLEHSVVEPGTLASAVALMQQAKPDDLDTQYDGHLGTASELVWTDVTYDLSQYTAQAATLHSQRVAVRRDTALPYDIDADARTQLVLMITQQLTYGSIRAHAEYCDMRHFRAGRSEIIRPVTLEAISFIRALVQDRATEAQLVAAVNAHADWVQAAKASTVFDQHLIMLRHIGQELGGGSSELFSTYARAREHFIHTSTVATPEALIRAVVPPAAADGFGVYATTVDAGTEYVVAWNDTTPQAREFVANLPRAAELLYDFLASCGPILES